MSSERYDEAVREQKKAERKKQVQKQVMILVIALVVRAKRYNECIEQRTCRCDQCKL